MAEKRPTRIVVDIAVIGDEISITNCRKYDIPINDSEYDHFFNKRLVINNKTSKEDIIKGIKDKIQEYKIFSEQNQKDTNNTPHERVNPSKGTENAKSPSKTPTREYTKYEPDDAYKGIKNDSDKYTPKDVMIYLSEIRSKNEGMVPIYLQTLHDELYDIVEPKVNENNTEWQKYNENKKIFLKIRDIDKSKSYRPFYSSYEAIKSKLDIAFKNILSNNAVPAVYLTALTSMKKAIDSHTDFKYVDKVIFDNEHFYKSDTLGYSNMKNLTNYLNSTIFERFTGKEQISVEEEGKTKYPPSINLKGFITKCAHDKKKYHLLV